VAAYLWFRHSPYLAMAWPLVVVGVLVLAVGLGVALRTPSQLAALEQGFQTARTQTVAVELERMKKVGRSFRIVKFVEIAMVAFGLLLVALVPGPGAGSSVGMGLVLTAAVLLVFDTVAQHRAETYVRWLQSALG
jgi:hypothetical protein